MFKRLCGVLALCLALAATAGAQERIAVLDTELPKGMDTKVVIPVTEKIMEEFVKSKLFTVLDRSFIARTLGELEFSTSDLTAGDSAKLAKIGGFLKASYIVVSTVQLLDKTYFLSAKMIEVKTGVITAQTSVNRDGSISVLIDMAGELGRNLVAAAMGQETSSSAGRTAFQEAPAESSVETPAVKKSPEPAKPTRSRFSTLCLDIGSGATIGYDEDEDTVFNYYSLDDDDTFAASGLNIGVSAFLPLKFFYLSGFGSLTTAENSMSAVTVTSEALALGAGAGINLLLGPIQTYAGIRAAYMAYLVNWDFTNSSVSDDTTTYSGLGFGFEIGGDIRLGILAIGIRYAIDAGSLPDIEGDYYNAQVAAGALAFRVGFAF